MSANGPRGMIAIFPTASSINLRSRFGSCAKVSASIAARRNAALCVISSPVGNDGFFCERVADAGGKHALAAGEAVDRGRDERGSPLSLELLEQQPDHDEAVAYLGEHDLLLDWERESLKLGS